MNCEIHGGGGHCVMLRHKGEGIVVFGSKFVDCPLDAAFSYHCNLKGLSEGTFSVT